jgi:hypothetical protein
MMSTDIAQRYPLPVYSLHGITYVPHYKEPKFIRPGYGINNFDAYTAFDLKALGARRTVEFLWSRACFDETMTWRV